MDWNADQWPNIRIALQIIGIDANPEECASFIRMFAHVDKISESDIKQVQERLEKDNPGRSFHSKSDRLLLLAQLLLASEHGIKMLRLALSRADLDTLHAVLGITKSEPT